MKSLISILAALSLRRARKPRVHFANIGEGTHKDGRKAFQVDPATTNTARYLLWKKGVDADHILPCGALDTPIGVSYDAYDLNNTDVPIAVELFGSVPGTVLVTSDGSLTDGCYVTTGALGQATAATTGQVAFGKALIGSDQTSAAGDLVEIIHDLPSKLTF